MEDVSRVVDTETGEIRDRDDGAGPRQLSHEAFKDLARAPHLWEVTETVVRKRLVMAGDEHEAAEMYEDDGRWGEPAPIAKRTVAVVDRGLV